MEEARERQFYSIFRTVDTGIKMTGMMSHGQPEMKKPGGMIFPMSASIWLRKGICRMAGVDSGKSHRQG